MSLIGQSCLQTMIMCQKACAIQRVLPRVYTVMRQSIIFTSGPLFKMLIKQNKKYVFAFSNAVHSLAHVEFQLGNLPLTMTLVWILKSVQNRQVCTFDVQSTLPNLLHNIIIRAPMQSTELHTVVWFSGQMWAVVGDQDGMGCARLVIFWNQIGGDWTWTTGF